MGRLESKMLLAGLLILGSATSSQAWWGWGPRWWGYGPSYYTPVYYYYPTYPVCLAPLPVAMAQPPSGAAPVQKLGESPRAASPKEPPTSADMMKKGPTIIESRSLGGAYAQLGNAKERCKVGFWNLTGRDVTLKIDGQPRVLAKNRAMTLDLERSFTWQLDLGDAVTERVPEEQPFHEVILRQ